MKILVTGFDPFNQEKINPAWEAVKRLPDEIAGATIVKVEIPTVFNQSAEALAHLIEEQRPEVVINVGQAGGRAGITPERVAINLDDARIPDNAQQQPIDQPIQGAGEVAYFTQLPVKAMVAAIEAKGIPASVSNSAGTFVCNHIMYQVQFMKANQYPFVKKAGFIHVPFLPEQVAKQQVPSMSLTDMVTGLTAAIEAVVVNETDLKLVGGAEH